MRPEAITRIQWLKYNYYFILEHFIGIKNSEKFIRKRRDKLYKKVKNNPGFENRGETIATSSIEYKNFEDFIAKNGRKALLHQPVVFRGAASNLSLIHI